MIELRRTELELKLNIKLFLELKLEFLNEILVRELN